MHACLCRWHSGVKCLPSSTCTWRWFGDESRRSGGRAKGWAAGGAAVWATGLALRQEDAELQPEFDLHREPGVKAKPQQSPSAGKERVQNLLAVEELEKYADAVVEEAEDVQMKKPEARRFLKAVAARKSSARYAPPPDRDAAGRVLLLHLARADEGPGLHRQRLDLRAQCDRQVAPDQADRPDLQRPAGQQEADAELRAAGCDRDPQWAEAHPNYTG